MARVITKFNMYTGEIEFTEVVTSDRSVPAKPEQMQSVVRQQDAALSSGESGGSAAGNPDGESIEGFEAWIESELEMANRLLHAYGRHNDILHRDELRAVKQIISKYKRRGAA